MAAAEARSLSVGDTVFVRHSNHKWTYVMVISKTSLELKIKLKEDATTHKILPAARWGGGEETSASNAAQLGIAFKQRKRMELN
jgi:hypothetical protein